MLDLITWVRAYDADAQHVQEVAFAGFDIQEIEAGTFDSVIAYVRSVDPHQADSVVQLYVSIRPDPTISWEQADQNCAQLPTSTKQQNITQAQQVYDLLAAHQTIYTAHSSSQTFALALQNAQVIVQSAQLSALDFNNLKDLPVGNNLRDAAMASNVAWIHEHSDGGAKMILLAHDGHIGVSASGGYTAMGMHLR